MSESNVIRYRIEFLSGHEGLGWMEVEQTNFTVVRIVKDDGEDVTNTGMSYKTTIEQ
jgi:hypothetical protein